MKKRYLILALAAVFMIFAAATAYTQNTATEYVAVSWSSTDDVALIEVDNSEYDLSSTGLSGSETYSASSPGERASYSKTTGSARGGVLNYTLHGQPLSRIDVECDTMGYEPHSLSVQISTDGSTEEILYGDGSATGGMTNSGSDELGEPVIGMKSINTVPGTVIFDIEGSDTWTGTSGNPDGTNTGGVPLYYTVTEYTGSTNLNVTYTLLAQ